ncbi:MAG: general secretion pathway protein GspK [Kofleriaceae bacterium]|nr:general secretion pathway protein GspK [Kofleriaceae bacterium]
MARIKIHSTGKKKTVGATRSPERGEQGVALLVVLTLLAVILSLVTEFTTNSTVNYMSAVNARESMRAQFLNRSGANLAQLVIRVQTDLLDKNRQMLGDIQISELPMLSLMLGAFGSSTEEATALASAFGGFEAKAIKGLGVAAGRFDVQITSDDGKLNVNCANGSKASRDNLRSQLAAMFYFKIYDPLFEEPDVEGWDRRRDNLVTSIMDYIDTDTIVDGERGSFEDYGYQSLDDRYKPKNNYIDTVSEIKLARGVDDRFWTLFGNQFTVYGGCKVNIGALADPRLIASLISLSPKDKEDPVVQDPQLLWKLAQRVASARMRDGPFKDINSFAEYVQDPTKGDLSRLVANAAGGEEPQAPESQEAVQGVELNLSLLGQIATAGPRRLYRVVVTSTFGQTPDGGARFTRKLTAIWDTQVQNQNMRHRDYRRGSWVFWREE